MPLRAHLLLEFLIEGCHPGSTVLFVCLHLLIEFLLRQLAQVGVLFRGLLDHLLLVLSFLRQVFQQIGLLALTKRQKSNDCIWTLNPEPTCESFTVE